MKDKYSNLPEEVQYYLQKYGMTTWSLFPNDNKKYKLAVVVPLIEEYQNIILLIKSLSNNQTEVLKKTIFIFVVNSIGNSNQDVLNDNHKTILLLKYIIENKKSPHNIIKKLNPNLNFAYVDVNSEGLRMPIKDGGVGFARKIGIDLALTVFDYSNGQDKNIILWLDADCAVAENYIDEVWNFFNKKSCSAGYVRFQHQLPDDEQEKLAIICYEIFLRYYVLGLKTAKSPYAFHTIGSTLACDVNSYIKIQGMNKKKAGEDFYFIEKLAKITDIGKIETTCVYPSSRPSWRVPFGTGRSVTRFLKDAQNEYLLYSPKSFFVLKEWLKIFENERLLSPSEYLVEANKIHPELKTFLIRNNFESDWEKILKHSKTSEQIKKQKRLWFDGFRTLKFIHHLRDNAFPQVNMFKAVADLLEYNKIRYKEFGSQISTEQQIEILNILRSIA